MKLFNQACSDDSSVQVDHYTFAIILRHWASTGSIQEMQEVVDQGVKRGLTPNAVIYGTLIRGFLRAGHLDKVDSTLKVMTEQDITPSRRLLPTIVAGIAKSGDMDRLRDAERIMATAQKLNLPVDIWSWAALAGGYFRGGWSQDGWDAIRRMEEAGVKLNGVAYHLIIQEASKRIEQGHLHVFTSVDIIKRMIADKIHPGFKTWQVLLLSLIKVENWNAARAAVELMEKLRVNPQSRLLQKLLFHVEWERKWGKKRY